MDTNKNHGFASSSPIPKKKQKSHNKTSPKPTDGAREKPRKKDGKFLTLKRSYWVIFSTCISYIFICPWIHEEKRDSFSYLSQYYTNCDFSGKRSVLWKVNLKVNHPWTISELPEIRPRTTTSWKMMYSESEVFCPKQWLSFALILSSHDAGGNIAAFSAGPLGIWYKSKTCVTLMVKTVASWD